MAVYLREISLNKKSFFIWAAAIIGLNIMVFSVYPSFSETMVNIQENFPEALVKIVGGDRLDLSNILHFYAMEIYLFVTLLGSIYAMMLGSGTISREEDYKTIEFLLAQPLSRENIITAKALGVLSYIVLLNILLFSSTYGLLEAFKKDDYSITAFLLLSLGAFLLHTTFASLGLLVSVFVKRARTSMSISLGVVLGTYFLSVASSISSKLDILRYLSPFKYVEAAGIITSGRIDALYAIIIAAIIAISTAGAYAYYHRKDIYN